VSSRRTSTSPSWTTLPSFTNISFTTPPLGCCTFLTLDSTITLPLAITAPASSLVAAQPPNPATNATTMASPAMLSRRIAGRARSPVLAPTFDVM